MLHQTPHTLGADLRALRTARGLTLIELAEKLDRSVGWLSQVERDLSAPSMADLRQLAKAMDVSVSMLSRHKAVINDEAGFVVRAASRRPVSPRVDGLFEELLSPDLTDDFEMVHSRFQPGASIKEPVIRPTQEVGFIITGKLDLKIGKRRFTVGPGDSFRIRGEAFTWANPYPETTVAIWVIAPPVY